MINKPEQRDFLMGKRNPFRQLIREADVIVEVVDARDVKGTRLLEAERWAGTRRLLIVANKSDLLSVGEIPKLPKHSIVVSAKRGGERDRKKLIRTILGRSISRPAKALFVGYPNVGKSSLINMLACRKAARVSPAAGTTKNVQWVRISPMLRVTDYRGVIPRSEKKKELVRKGAMEIHGGALMHAHAFLKNALTKPTLLEWLEGRFDVTLSKADSSEDILEAIAKRRGLYLKGGELNIEEAAKIIMRASRVAPEM
jgi:ribosome biogenesis GTPase A